MAAGERASQLVATVGQAIAGAFERVMPRSRALRVLISAFLLLAISAAFLYPAVRDYYTAVREKARMEAAYEVAVQRTQALEADVAALSTDTGIEDRAREEYGWVRPGENSVTVTGLQQASQPTQTADEIPSVDSVTAPETWYSPALDALFGYAR